LSGHLEPILLLAKYLRPTPMCLNMLRAAARWCRRLARIRQDLATCSSTSSHRRDDVSVLGFVRSGRLGIWKASPLHRYICGPYNRRTTANACWLDEGRKVGEWHAPPACGSGILAVDLHRRPEVKRHGGESKCRGTTSAVVNREDWLSIDPTGGLQLGPCLRGRDRTTRRHKKRAPPTVSPRRFAG
jgi:hypothetical protein